MQLGEECALEEVIDKVSLLLLNERLQFLFDNREEVLIDGEDDGFLLADYLRMRLLVECL